MESDYRKALVRLFVVHWFPSPTGAPHLHPHIIVSSPYSLYMRYRLYQPSVKQMTLSNACIISAVVIYRNSATDLCLIFRRCHHQRFSPSLKTQLNCFDWDISNPDGFLYRHKICSCRHGEIDMIFGDLFAALMETEHLPYTMVVLYG